MPQFDELLLTYLHLAHASQRRRQLLVRDKLLVLAGMTALELDREDISASCRERILQHNPRHLLRRWPDLATAARAERFRAYLKQLRRKYSPEKAEHMLDSLGISLHEAPGAGHHRSGSSSGEVAFADRAAQLVQSLVIERDERQAAPAVRPQNAAGRVRSQDVAPNAAAGAVASWWPFWLGLSVWLVLALLRIFGPRWSG